MADTAERIRLSSETLEPFTAYIREVETAMQSAVSSLTPFLWADAESKRVTELAKGKAIAESYSGKKPIHLPHGLIHDWIGSVCVPAVTLEQVLAVMQDYDNHKTTYQPDVLDSKLVFRQGDDFTIFLRLLKKRIITVVLDTEHEVHYESAGIGRALCSSHTTRISEVQNPGKPDEQRLPPDTGYGFLWRLHSYWRLEEKADGVTIECRAISLTRDVPKGLAWIIDPIISKVPKESLLNTLIATQRALQPRPAGSAASAGNSTP